MEQTTNQKLSKKERKLLKKQEKEEARKQGQRKKRTRNIGLWIIVVLILVSAGFGIWKVIKKMAPKGPDPSVESSIQGRDHIGIGATHPAYNSNPPSSGSHYGEAAKAGFYDEELPDEQLVHNMEHGEIWISYRPEVGDKIIDELKKFAGSTVTVTPRSANDMDIALAAWGRLDKFNVIEGGLDKPRIENFITRHIDKGPEKLSTTRSMR